MTQHVGTQITLILVQHRRTNRRRDRHQPLLRELAHGLPVGLQVVTALHRRRQLVTCRLRLTLGPEPGMPAALAVAGRRVAVLERAHPVDNPGRPSSSRCPRYPGRAGQPERRRRRRRQEREGHRQHPIEGRQPPSTEFETPDPAIRHRSDDRRKRSSPKCQPGAHITIWQHPVQQRMSSRPGVSAGRSSKPIANFSTISSNSNVLKSLVDGSSTIIGRFIGASTRLLSSRDRACCAGAIRTPPQARDH